MKRLVWLLLLAFGTATAQVQPVDVRLVPEEKCCCCADGANACDMPEDCAPAPTSCAQPAVQLQSPVQAVAKRALPAPQAAREKFYVQFVPRARIAPALPVTAVAAPAASVPRFQEHCSFLI
jgi:hypothetical protein